MKSNHIKIIQSVYGYCNDSQVKSPLASIIFMPIDETIGSIGLHF